MKDWRQMHYRLERTLFSGQKNRSLHVMEVAVDHFKNINKDKLSKVDYDFVSDLSRKITITPCAMMLAIVYLERLKLKNPQFVHQVSSADLFLISTMMSSKYMHDEGIDDDVYNEDWAGSANMSVQDLNLLEMEFLQAIDWALFINSIEFDNTLESMEFEVAKRCAAIRGGWLTYTDLLVLSRKIDFHSLFADSVMMVFSTCIIFYTSILTLLTGYLASSIMPRISHLTTHRGAMQEMNPAYPLFVVDTTYAHGQLDNREMHGFESPIPFEQITDDGDPNFLPTLTILDASHELQQAASEKQVKIYAEPAVMMIMDHPIMQNGTDTLNKTENHTGHHEYSIHTWTDVGMVAISGVSLNIMKTDDAMSLQTQNEDAMSLQTQDEKPDQPAQIIVELDTDVTITMLQNDEMENGSTPMRDNIQTFGLGFENDLKPQAEIIRIPGLMNSSCYLAGWILPCHRSMQRHGYNEWCY